MDNQITTRTIPKKFLRLTPVRDAYIVSLCKGKKVLHVGASDWPFTKEKIDRGCLLYQSIGSVAQEQLGIDLDQKASDFLNEKSIRNSRIEVRDMNELQSLSFSPEVIILGEVLEHLMNLEVALNNMKAVMHKDTIMIVSVPNALYFMNFVYALIRREHQHPDHSVAFTYKTLTQLIQKVGLVVDDFTFTFLASTSQLRYLNWKGKIMFLFSYFLSHVSPLFSETLLVIVKKPN